MRFGDKRMAKVERLEKSPEGKRISNKTDLRIFQATARGQIHRDYLAHCLRWTHVIKYLGKMRKNENFSILDLGCGKEFPLLRTVYTNKVKPHYYLATDIRELDLEELHEEMTPNFEHEFKQVDFVESVPEPKYDNWDVIVFLEVLEHIPKEDGIKILENIKSVMDSETVLFISTPIFSSHQGQAGNHVYEWKHEELKEELEKHFIIEGNYGTFASQKDIEPAMSDCEKEVYEKLKKYYDSNVLSILFAPIHPAQSRNSIFRLKLKKD